MVRNALVVFVPLLALVFQSCGFREPVKEFFKEYTETASIEAHAINLDDVPVDKDGYKCIPSANMTSISFFMRNPQNYIINFDYKMDDENVQSVSQGDGYFVMRQESADLTVMDLSLAVDFLREIDCGGNLSSSISLTESKTLRVFDPYYFSLRCNSVPEPVRNLTVLQNNSTNTYVLAMNMPDMSGIHRDIKKITIDGESFDVSLPSSPSPSDTGLSERFLTEFDDSAWGSGANGISFSGRDGERAVYFQTDKEFQTDEYFFDVTVEDEAGLSVSSKVSDHSKQLSDVVFEADDLSTLETDDYGYAHILVDAPTETVDGSPVSDVTVYWRLYDAGGNLKTQGSGIGKADIGVATGKWRIETWAHKVGYIDSATVFSDVSASGYLFVKPSFEGISDGSRMYPYTTFEDAVNAVVSANLDYLRVEILEDVELAEEFRVEPFNAEIRAHGALTLSGTIRISGGHYLVVNSDILLGEIQMEEGALIKTRGVGASGDVVANVVYNGDLVEDSVLMEGVDSDVTQELADRFLLKNRGYYIKSLDVGGVLKGVVGVSGVKVKVDTAEGAYTVSVTGLDAAEAGSALSVSSIADFEGNDVDVSRVTKMKVYADGILVKESNGSSIVLDLEYTGAYKYTLEVIFSDRNIEVSAQFPFEIHE